MTAVRQTNDPGGSTYAPSPCKLLPALTADARRCPAVAQIPYDSGCGRMPWGKLGAVCNSRHGAPHAASCKVDPAWCQPAVTSRGCSPSPTPLTPCLSSAQAVVFIPSAYMCLRPYFRHATITLFPNTSRPSFRAA